MSLPPPALNTIHTGPHTPGPAAERARELTRRHAHLHGAELLAPLIRHEFAGRIAVVSSFGAESAALLALVAEVDPATPVVFVDTGRLFAETHRYRARLSAALGLSDVRIGAPHAERLGALDATETLWQHDADACCELRKVAPLAAALTGFDAWITGRKRFHGEERSLLPSIEATGERFRINPMAGYEKHDIDTIFASRGLPRHPLEADGYLSIGCMPCTARAECGGGVRSGRWQGRAKTECGIHRLS